MLQNFQSIDEFLSGRQELYKVLEQKLENKGFTTPAEIQQIIGLLNERTGAYGTQRKHLLNNLFKAIIDLSFPNFLKYLFWETTQTEGIFSGPRRERRN